MASQQEEEYDPSKPFASVPSPQPSASNQARLAPPPPTLQPINGHPPSASPGPPPPTLFAGAPPFPSGGFPPPPPFPAGAGQNSPHPPFPPPFPPGAGAASGSYNAYQQPPKPPTVFGPPKVGLATSHDVKPRGPYQPKQFKSKQSGGFGDGTIQDSLRHALYQGQSISSNEIVAT